MRLKDTLREIGGLGIRSLVIILVIAMLNPSQAQSNTVTGIVTDSETREEIPGLTVTIKGTSSGVITDIDGSYEIGVKTGDVLVFSFVGFVSQEIIINGQSKVDVEMDLDIQSLEEVIVTGYGQTQNRVTVSTAIQSISPKTIEDRPITRIEQALQGASPAVVVMKESGSPGAPLTIRMRGISTAGDSNPLILLNGVQVPDMSFINPSDIKNISVLKDASASSIYGARGGNGVILLQTKAGTNQKPTVSLSTYYGVQRLASEGEYLNGQEYAQYYNNSVNYLIRQGQPAPGRGKFTQEEIDLLPETTWIREITSDQPISDIQVGVSGGSDKVSYYLGAGSFDQGGIISNTNFNRKSLTLDVKSQIKKNLELNVFATYSANKRTFIPENSENSRLLSSVASLPSIYPVYDENGNPFNNGRQGPGLMYNGVPLNAIAEFGNPILGLKHSQNVSQQDVLYSNALLRWEIVKGLKVNVSGGYMTRENFSRFFGQRFDYPDQGYLNEINGYTETNFNELFYQGESFLSYDKKISSFHSVSAIVGVSALSQEFSSNGLNATDFFPNSFEDVNFSNVKDFENIASFIPSAGRSTVQSAYLRLVYDFKEKYLFTATLRSDASSRFGPSNNRGYFPSVSAGWVVSNEPFLAQNELFGLIKLRASWGVNGIDNIPNYDHIPRFSRSLNGLSFIQADPNIKWEEVSQSNIGLDLDLLKNKLGITLDYYVKNTTDMLINLPSPEILGEGDPVRNTASVSNRGFEVLTTYRDKLGEEFNFNINFNIGFNSNEVTDIGSGRAIDGASTRVFKDAPALTRTDKGHPIASFFGFKFTGLDEQGNPIYLDLNEDNELTDDDRTFIGNPFPDFNYGINITLNYKGFDFTAFASGTEGNDVVNASMGYGFQYSNRTRQVLDAWSVENPNSNIMRPSALEVENHEFSDYYIEDGSYLRLRNITLGYTLPKSLIESLKLTSMRVYISGNNLLTFTGYSGYDPEIGINNSPLDVGVDRGFYPIAKSITGGLNLTF